jgi:hypothetical protein
MLHPSAARTPGSVFVRALKDKAGKKLAVGVVSSVVIQFGISSGLSPSSQTLLEEAVLDFEAPASVKSSLV